MRLKQKIVFALVFAIGATVTTLTARQIFNGQHNQVPYTAGLDAVPAIHVPIVVLNFASLGYIERADNRTYLAHTGQASLDASKKANLLDIALSFVGAVCLLVISRRVSRKIINDE
jgi:hypothetical protein